MSSDQSANPFLDLDKHLFITNFDETKPRSGAVLIKQWRLRDQYPCSFFQISEKGETFYKVEVTHRARKDYLKLPTLPVEMFYMAYHLNQTLEVLLTQENTIQYLFMRALASKRQFIKQMEDLELKYFGVIRSKLD